MMTPKIGNIIEELDRFVSDRNKHKIIESRAVNLIVSCHNLMQLIEDSFDEDQAEELNKRLLLALKNNDEKKFTRRMHQLEQETIKGKKK